MQRLFIHNIRYTTFVTLFLGAFDPTTRTFAYSNAGHNPPLVLRNHKSGGLSRVWLNPTGAAIGLVEEPDLAEEALHLADGDLLAIYTDGVTEATDRHGEIFGRERLATLLERRAQSSPKEVVQAIKEGLEVHTEGRPLSDDTTVVVCRISQDLKPGEWKGEKDDGKTQGAAGGRRAGDHGQLGPVPRA